MQNIFLVSQTLPKCFLWDPPCLKVKVQGISSILSAGVPDLDVQPLDTIVIDFIHIDKEGYRIDLRSMRVKGMSDAVVDDIRHVLFWSCLILFII